MARRNQTDRHSAPAAGTSRLSATHDAARRVHYQRVLVVDPDDDTRLLYRRAFELAGFDVVEAADGRDALVKALDRPPSVVVMEARLPILDGYSLCEILRRDRATAAVPILVVTSEAGSDRAHVIKSSGADVVLVKPAQLEAILSETKRLAVGRPDRRDQSDAEAGSPQPPGESTARPHLRQSKAHLRFDTTDPPSPPPPLHCPVCDAQLVYQYSHVGGVSNRHAEQWDYFTCSGPCGGFEYRQRTRKIRRVAGELRLLPKTAAS
jgi:CheY-like chemotaxis protein